MNEAKEQYHRMRVFQMSVEEIEQANDSIKVTQQESIAYIHEGQKKQF